MKCPKCGNEVQQHEASVLYGIKDERIEILASGNFILAFCCGVAIMTERHEDKAPIVTPNQGLLIPT